MNIGHAQAPADSTHSHPTPHRPNVLLVGHLEPTKLRTFLTEFFHPDRRTDVNQAAFYHVRW